MERENTFGKNLKDNIIRTAEKDTLNLYPDYLVIELS